jgi:hypothetical protein
MPSAAATDGAARKAFTAGREAAAAYTAAVMQAAATSAGVGPQPAVILSAAVMQAAGTRAGAGPRAAVIRAAVVMQAAAMQAADTLAAVALAENYEGRRADRIRPGVAFQCFEVAGRRNASLI